MFSNGHEGFCGLKTKRGRKWVERKLSLMATHNALTWQLTSCSVWWMIRSLMLWLMRNNIVNIVGWMAGWRTHITRSYCFEHASTARSRGAAEGNRQINGVYTRKLIVFCSKTNSLIILIENDVFFLPPLACHCRCACACESGGYGKPEAKQNKTCSKVNNGA